MKKFITVLVLFAVASLCTMTCAAEPELRIENERFENSGIVYEVSSNEPLAGALICAVYDASGVLSNVAIEENPSAQTKWTIRIDTQFEKGKSKMFFWNSIENMQPWAKSVSSDWDKNKPVSLYEEDSRISDVVNDPCFGSYGRLIFPVIADTIAATLWEISD